MRSVEISLRPGNRACARIHNRNEDEDKDKRKSKERRVRGEYCGRITVSAWRFRGLVKVR